MVSEFNVIVELERKRALRRRALLTLLIPIFILTIAIVVFLVFSKSINVTTEDNVDVNPTIVRSSGLTLSLANKVLALSEDAAVDIIAQGYRTETLRFQNHRGVRIIDLELELAQLEVTVKANIPLENPEWFLDDKYIGSQDVLKFFSKPKTRLVSVVADNIEKYSLELDIPRNGESSFELEVAAAQRDIQITSIPNNALVKLDNKEIGKTPLVTSALTGTFSLEVSKAGYKTVSRKISIRADQEKFHTHIDFSEKRKDVSLTVEPKNGSLLINQEDYGDLKSQSSTIRVSQARPAVITYSKEGYKTFSGTLDLNQDHLNISLKPVYGTVNVSSNESAHVYVDREYKGETPLTLRLLAKTQTISLQSPNFMEYSQKIKVKENQNQFLNLTLESKKSFYLSRSQKSFTNAVGIEMKRFLPTSFVMGAPRGEVGQEAHEIQRRVDFTRHIYFSSKEVTQSQFNKFKANSATSNKPVTNISWVDAALFCNWLSDQEGLERFYRIRDLKVVGYDPSSIGYRLPTEAEWEWAAKLAGKPVATVFSWGNPYKIPPQVGNIADKSADGTVAVFNASYNDGHAGLAPVASFKANKAGLYDLFGNASEWVHDSYSRSPADLNKTYMDYMGPQSITSERVAKGSNYKSESWTELRNSFRKNFNGSNDLIGFRVARYIY